MLVKAIYHSSGPCYTIGMSTALYRALIDAGASDEKAVAASEEQERILRLEKDIADIKGRLNLLIAVVIPLLVVIIVRLFGIA